MDCSDGSPAFSETHKADRIFPAVVGTLLIASAIVLCCWVYIIFGHANYFDGYFANGAFQLWNPMRRIMDGQLPGRDFFVFHGIGTIWLHLPVYFALGESLQAAEVSRFTTSGLLHVIASYWLYSVISKISLERRLTIILALLFFLSAPIALDRIFFPQNSLLGVRSVFPIFVGLAILSGSGLVTLCLLSAAALVISPEHGVATIVGLVAVVGSSWLSAKLRETLHFTKAIFLALLIYVAAILISSGGVILPTLRYSFGAIPTDQFWYFGVRPNSYLPVDWGGLLQLGFYIFISIWIMALGLTIVFWRTKSIYRNVSVFLFVYATFGVVSQLGYLFPRNLQGSERALIIILLLGAVQFLRKNYAYAFVASGFLALSAWGWEGRAAIAYAWPAKPASKGNFLSPYWSDQVAAVNHLANGGVIWSIYAGLPEALRKDFAPSFDYIIHALGPENRKIYRETFEKTKPSVVRLDNAREWNYGWWLISSNWDFYKSVFSRYELVYSDKMSTLWIPTQKQPGNEQASLLAKPLPVNDGCFLLKQSSQKTSTMAIRLRYSLTNPWRKVPLLGDTPRIIMSSERPQDYGTSLPPPISYGGDWEVPVILKPGEELRMCVRVDTFLSGVRLDVQEAWAYEPQMTDSARNYLTTLWQ
jgi:hypothetical protein